MYVANAREMRDPCCSPQKRVKSTPYVTIAVGRKSRNRTIMQPTQYYYIASALTRAGAHIWYFSPAAKGKFVWRVLYKGALSYLKCIQYYIYKVTPTSFLTSRDHSCFYYALLSDAGRQPLARKSETEMYIHDGFARREDDLFEENTVGLSHFRLIYGLWNSTFWVGWWNTTAEIMKVAAQPDFY